MAYAEFFVTTASATTSVTMFGTYGPWIELPDAFPPILWIDTSSTTTRTPENVALWILGGTSVSMHGTAWQKPLFINHKVQVQNYEPGTRWLLPADCGSFALGSGNLGVGEACLSNTGVSPPVTGARRWKLYYRAVGEGPDPRRMV